MKKYITIDIGGTKVAVSLFGAGRLMKKQSEATALTGDNKALPLQVIRLVNDLMMVNGLESKDIDGFGVSTCGPFDKSDGLISLVAPNICGGLSDGKCVDNDWKSVPLERELKIAFPGVKIDNDCLAAAQAERLFGAGVETDNFVYVTWSTGLGTGAFVDGRPIRGKNGNAPHLGHSVVTDVDPHLCGCGQYGHLEGEVAGNALGRQYGNGASAKDVFVKYREGDVKAIEIVERAVELFGKGLASINAILDNQLFTIGGSVFTENQDLLLPRIIENFNKYAYVPLGTGVNIISSPLGANIADLGALALIIDEDEIDLYKNNLNDS